MAEAIWDVLSLRGEHNEPLLGNCSLLIGDHVLVFSDGVAQAPESLIPSVLADKRVKVPGYRGPVAATAAQISNGVVAAPEPSDIESVLAEDEAALGITVRPAGEPLTTDGQPRCQARKGDGSQCANVASDGAACGLAAHRSQLA